MRHLLMIAAVLGTLTVTGISDRTAQAGPVARAAVAARWGYPGYRYYGYRPFVPRYGGWYGYRPYGALYRPYGYYRPYSSYYWGGPSFRFGFGAPYVGYGYGYPGVYSYGWY